MYHTVIVSTIFFFFNDTATTEIYTLSLHDALPICPRGARRSPPRSCRGRWTGSRRCGGPSSRPRASPGPVSATASAPRRRSEEHTSELQSQSNLVCRLLLEKKNKPAYTLPSYSTG